MLICDTAADEHLKVLDSFALEWVRLDNMFIKIK